MRIAIASDHNGVELKVHLLAWLKERGEEVDDRGAHDSEPVDYPPICADVARRILDGHADRGIIVGGSGSGEQIACNKIPGIRAVLCDRVLLAEIARANNDTNVLVLGAMIVGDRLAERITARWLDTAFTHGRHLRRLEQIAALERGEPLA